MAETPVRIKTRLLKEYYQHFSKYSKGKQPEKKVAWVTSFTPVEILEALDILYYYPESYSAVTAASEKEQEMLSVSRGQFLSPECCSYSCCFEGCLSAQMGPRGIPPMPDVLIATNNQCNTLPGWWSFLSKKYNIPIIILDYPGEAVPVNQALPYVTSQHQEMIRRLEKLSGNTLDQDRLSELIGTSRKSVHAWEKVISYLSTKALSPTILFDDINFLITARCKPETVKLYELTAVALNSMDSADSEKIPVYWIGYPLWYHPRRYPEELMEDFRITGANYLTWWNLDYNGKNVFEDLFSAYNYTFLNLTQDSRDKKLSKLIRASGAVCAVVLHNRSCKCDFVSARNVMLPQAELQIDMIDRTFLDTKAARERLTLLKEMVCSV